jgi:hypothetical protein
VLAGTTWHVGDVGYREAQLAVSSAPGLIRTAGQDPFVDCAGRVLHAGEYVVEDELGMVRQHVRPVSRAQSHHTTRSPRPGSPPPAPAPIHAGHAAHLGGQSRHGLLSSGRHHWERAARPRPVSLRGRRRVWRVGVEFRITGITWLGVVGDASGVFD